MTKRGKALGFRPDGDTEITIQRALEATGMNVTDLLTRCVKRALPDVVRDVVEERRAAAADFLREHPTPYRTKKT